MSLDNKKPAPISKVPWEPYKAATNSTSLLKSSSHFQNQTQASSNLIKYKISTDLEKFNSKRPGYQFDECDFKSIEENEQNLNDDLNEILVKQKLHSRNEEYSNNNNKEDDLKYKDHKENAASFIDARFYTDYHFLKLANQLKKNTIGASDDAQQATTSKKTNFSNSQPNSNKPVNVVGPLIESKANNSSNETLQSSSASVSPYGADNNSIRLWKSQKNQYELKIDYLESQIKGMSEQLQIQTQVNAELKKMLVASIGGEDMQYKLERLIKDKQRYEIELTNNTKTIERLNEDIEQINIQCDLWRSKFLASKLMAEENSTWKSFLLLLNRQNDIVLRKLLGSTFYFNL